MRMLMAVAAAAVLALPVSAQQDSVENLELTFNFKEASVDAVLQYVSKVTDWVFVQDSKASSTIDAVAEAKIPAAKVIEFLNAALRKPGLTITNPHSPNLPKRGQVLKVMTIEKAKTWSLDIFTGMDDIPITDQVRTQIIPLKAVNVVEVNKELGELIKKAMGDGDLAVSTYSNSLVLNGRADGINRAARILKVIDVGTSGELKVKVFPLKNADATEAAKTLNDVFKKEAAAGQTGQQNPMGRIWEMFGGGGRGGGERGGGGAGPQPRALAHEMVRITPDTRINALIVSATDDNMRIIADLIEKLDDKSAAAIKLQHYPLRFADATITAKLINDIFADTPTNQQSNRGGGNRGQGFMPAWMPGAQQGGGGETLGATKEVRAVADLRTNSVLVAASEQKIAIINELMERIDRQISDLLLVKIYKLKHADPAQMASVLQSLFRPQVNATQSAGSGRTQQGQGNQGGGGFMGMMMAGGNRGSQTQPNPLLPSQEIEITSDVRTNAVIVKASKEFISIIDDVVKQLDADPTEAMSTYVYRLRNNDATTLAQAIQNLARGGTGTTATGLNQRTTGTQGLNQQQGLNGRNNLQNNTGGGTRGGAAGGGGSSRTRSGTNLGPLDQEEPAGPVQEEDPQRRGLEGQVDVQADPSTNSLIIRTSPRNYQAIQNMLQELDRLRPQVLIKVLIADVTLDENTQFGVEGFWENKMRVRGGDQGTNRFGTDFALATQGFSYLLTGDEFQASLNVFAREGKLKILATPRILALDNQTASINVGKEVPRISNTTVNQLGNTVNTVQYENIGILLDVTPQINPDGLVTLTVAPEISDLASESESVEISPGVRNPTFNVNRASTTVSVRNGTTVVIGGLIRETKDDAVQKVPLLGDIPLIGLLFSSTTQRKVKRELMIFLTPYVAFTAAELEEITQLEKSRLKLLDPRDIEAESDRWLERMR